MSQNANRTLVVGVIAAVLFGAFLLVGPNLTASSETAAPGTTIAVGDPITTAPVITTTLPVPTSQPRTSPDGPEEWDPERMTPALGYDGSIALTAVPDLGIGVVDGEEVNWEVSVVNNTDGRLWGVFAWVEGYGRAYCEDSQLEPGETTICWARHTAWSGKQDVVAWANAWDLDSQVKAKVLVEVVVADR